MRMPTERIIGIDFGTSTSVIKIKTYKDNEPIGIANAVEYVRFDNKDSLPTLVYETGEGKFLIGYEAENAAVKGILRQNFKLDLISGDASLRNEAVRLTKIFFRHMFKEYDEQRSYFPACDTETTYISYPAKWSRELRELMIQIAREAGFKNVMGLDEPTAAIHTVMVQEGKKLDLGGREAADILVIDMGAGTTDLVLCRYFPNRDKHIDILDTWPKDDSQCLFGGREVDEALCEYIKAYLVDCGLPNAKNFKEKYLDKCKAWKEANLSPILNDKNGVVRYCGFIDALLSMLDVDREFPPISRNDFENMLGGYITQFPKMIDDCLRDAGFDGRELDHVILTGGHSQWYFTNEILDGTLTRFGNPDLPKIKADAKRIIKLSRPQETVALGLVFQKISIIHEKACGNCGKKIAASDPFCGYCGRRNTDIGGDTGKPGGSARGEIICAHCGKKIAANAPFCGYCGQANPGIGGGAGKPDERVKSQIICGHCGKRILENSGFCGYCGSPAKPSEAKRSPMVITRDSQLVCMAVQYKVVVNGIDYGKINVGQSKTVPSETPVATVEILCTTVMMANNRIRMKLKLGNNPRINFKVQYGGRIMPVVQGAEILEKSYS